MGSCVSLSIWNRTSLEARVNALQDKSRNLKLIITCITSDKHSLDKLSVNVFPYKISKYCNTKVY